jgi:hypothetical protein
MGQKQTASSRSFGLLFAAFFVAIAAINHWRHHDFYPYFAALALLFLLISLLMPRLLAPLKRLWLKLGAVLGLVVAPIVLVLSYALAIVPVGLLIRIFGKDLLSLKHDGPANSYWIKRELGGPTPGSLKDQF